MWAQDLGLHPEASFANCPERDPFAARLSDEEQAFTFPPKLEQEDSPYGTLHRLASAVQCTSMPRVALSPVVAHLPKW